MIEKQHVSAMCFLCGTENEKGLGLTWFTDTDNKLVYCDTIIPDEYCGHIGVVHGGIIASILDETAGRAVNLGKNYRERKVVVTKNLELEYIKPTPPNTPLHASGRIESINGRHCKVKAELTLKDGTVTARANAIIVVDPQHLNLVYS